MELSLSASEVVLHKVKCPACSRAMRLVGIEPHPKIPDMVDLFTYECACGKVVAEPRLSEVALGPLAPAT